MSLGGCGTFRTLQDVFLAFLITRKGNTSCYGILFQSKAASAPRPRAHGTNQGDKQGRVKERFTQQTDGPFHREMAAEFRLFSKVLLSLKDRVEACRYTYTFIYHLTWTQQWSSVTTSSQSPVSWCSSSWTVGRNCERGQKMQTPHRRRELEPSTFLARGRWRCFLDEFSLFFSCERKPISVKKPIWPHPNKDSHSFIQEISYFMKVGLQALGDAAVNLWKHQLNDILQVLTLSTSVGVQFLGHVLLYLTCLHSDSLCQVHVPARK